MRETPQIRFERVSKNYRLYSSLTEQALDVLGLSWIRFWRRPQYRDFPALKDVSIEVMRGERLAIVGRNGAGKTTLLKMLTGNFGPTSGSVYVKGRVQALMNLGIGFHPEFTGYENVRSALAYNGVAGSELEAALDDVVSFVELGDFLHQPLKTYSLGMQGRLMFATSTAIKPDILIVDEILSAGDAYFSAKSSHRMEALTSGGCTLLLVSHSMQQVLQFCNRAIWLEGGEIVMQGAALPVVKAYEEYSQKLDRESQSAEGKRPSVLQNQEIRQRLLKQVFRHQEDSEKKELNTFSEASSAGGVSRWSGEPGLRIENVRVLDATGQPGKVLRSGTSAIVEITLTADEEGNFPCSFVVVLFTSDGRPLSRHCSDQVIFRLAPGEKAIGKLVLDQLMLGNGEYFFSAAIYKELDLARLSAARAYDLLSRSFEFKVLDEYVDDVSVFHHPGRWLVEKGHVE